MAFPQYGAPSPTEPNQGKTPQGGLGQIMQRLLGGARSPQSGGPQPAPTVPPAPVPQAPAPNPGFGMPGMPPGMPDPASGAPMIPGQPPMPGPGGPMQGASISPEEYQAMLEQIKGELMKQIAGQSGQQDSIYTAASGLGRYRPMQGLQGPMGAPPQPPPGMPPQDVQYPPGMDRSGLDMYRQTGNPNPGMGLPAPRPQLRPRPAFMGVRG